MKSIFVLGTAGAGKSLLTSKLLDYYSRNGVFAAALNLDPGVESLPYTCDIDARDYVDLLEIMRQYSLGPNGALIIANDLLATRSEELLTEINGVNPDYLIIDTPGQIELAAYRNSGGFLIDSIGTVGEKTSVFLFDGALITTPTNFVSISLLATSIKLRLNLPAINIITKTDIIKDKIKDILDWSTNLASLEEAITDSANGEIYTLTMNILRGLDTNGFGQEMIPVSNVTEEGLVELETVLSRILNLGEEIED